MGIFSRSGSSKSGEKRDWLRRLVMPSGHSDPKIDERKRAAAEDVAEIREDDEYFSPDGPENQRDEL
jgi:hypothetical protein